MKRWRDTKKSCQGERGREKGEERREEEYIYLE